jgi:hypothetical protein
MTIQRRLAVLVIAVITALLAYSLVREPEPHHWTREELEQLDRDAARAVAREGEEAEASARALAASTRPAATRSAPAASSAAAPPQAMRPR